MFSAHSTQRVCKEMLYCWMMKAERGVGGCSTSYSAVPPPFTGGLLYPETFCAFRPLHTKSPKREFGIVKAERFLWVGSTSYSAAPPPVTGGLLCDDMGLDKNP